MVEAVALKRLIKDGRVVGYKLKDNNNKIMDVPCDAIMKVIQAGKLNVINLEIVDNELVMKEVTLSKEPVEDKSNTNKEVIAPTKKETVEADGSRDSKLKRMAYLVEKLNEANRVYEQGKDEIMSNKEYDALYDELLELEKELDTVLSNSPTVNVGYEVVSALPKEEHSEKMMSLDKSKDIEVIKGFVGNQECMLGWKLDGLTVVLTYNNGVLVKAVTRGNGTVGELVTNNAKQFKGLPKQIPFKGELVIRGEAIISYSDFNKINSKIVDGEKYKNPRNLASGSVRQLDSAITASRAVHFVAFNLVKSDGKSFEKVDETYKFMRDLGFEVVESKKVNQGNLEAIIALYSSAVKNKKIDIPVDGMVITYNDIAYGKSLGCTAKFPRHSIAMKWEDECAETTLEYIEWSASRTGLINPVAVFKPVDIEGSTISRASVHNVSIMKELELGYGDRITVYKANLIIPQIDENLTRSDTCEIPDTCPVCGCETTLKQDPTSGVYTLWCENELCPAKGHKSLEHFVSRDAMNIVGISGSTLARLMEEGIVTTASSLYELKMHEGTIVNMDGFGYQSFYKMVEAIEKSRNVKLSNFIYALGIPNVGLATAKLICKHFDFDVRRVVNANLMELTDIEGIGEVIANSFVEYFASEDNRKEFLEIYKNLNLLPEVSSTGTSMNGVVICVTGDVYVFSSRRHLKEKVEELGGKVTGSVSRSTSYLVTNDTSTGSNKNKKAKEYGIPILTEEQFIEKFGIEV